MGKNRAMEHEEIVRIKVLAATASLEHSTYNRVDTKNLCQIGVSMKRHFALQQQTIMRGIKVRGNVQSYCAQNCVNTPFIYF